MKCVQLGVTAAMALALAGLLGLAPESDKVKIAEAAASSPTTRFEKFAAADGVLKIKEVFPLKAPQSKYGACEAKLVRVTNVQSGETATALILSYKGTERYDREVHSVLDEDEIGSLGTALDYIRQNRSRLVTQAIAYTEVTYLSRGGFIAGFYVSEKKTQDYLEIGRESVFIDTLADVESLVKQAASKIAELKKK